jgi:glycosyltransferase involved in cell wall biosynthesis
MRRGLPSVRSIFKLRSIIHGLQPDIIQGWMYHGNLAAWLAQRFAPGKPILVWNIRQSLYNLNSEKPLTQKVIRTNRWLSSSADALLYNSQLSRQQHQQFGFCSKHGRVIPNGFDLNIWKPALKEGKNTIRSRENIPTGATVIGHVARYHPMKDHARFIRAAVRVVASHPDVDVHVVLVGRNVDSNNEALLMLVPGEFRSRFHWLGERHDLPDLMQMMDVVCLSSAWGEAFPNVLGETMACGIPGVATDVGDSALIVGDTGEIVPPEDDNALFSGLMKMVDTTPEEREVLGQAARCRIASKFSLNAVVNQYVNLYEQLVQKKGKA